MLAAAESLLDIPVVVVDDDGAMSSPVAVPTSPYASYRRGCGARYVVEVAAVVVVVVDGCWTNVLAAGCWSCFGGRGRGGGGSGAGACDEDDAWGTANVDDDDEAAA